METKINEKDVINLYKKHGSINKVKKLFNASWKTIKNILERNNIITDKHPISKWTKEKLHEEALKYNSRSEFIRNTAGAYASAKKMGILNDICSHMEWLGHRYARHVYLCKFSNNTVYVGLSYDPKVRFRQHLNDYRSSVYKHSKEKNEEPELIYLTESPLKKEEAVELEKNTISKYLSMGYTLLNDTTRDAGQLGVPDLFYTDDMLKEYALRFKNRAEMKKDNINLYNLINRRKLNHFFDHMEWQGNTTYDHDEVLKIAQKYQTRNELRKNEPRVWGYINRNGLQNMMFGHMQTLRTTTPLTYEDYVKITERYTVLNDFIKENPRIYYTLKRKDFYGELTKHMERKFIPKITENMRKGHLKNWTQEDVDQCAELYRSGMSYKEISEVITNKTREQIRNKVHHLIQYGELENNGTGTTRHNKEMIKEFIEKNNIKYKYGPNGLRSKNTSMFFYLERNNLFEELLPEDDGNVRSEHNGKTYIMRKQK